MSRLQVAVLALWLLSLHRLGCSFTTGPHPHHQRPNTKIRWQLQPHLITHHANPDATIRPSQYAVHNKVSVLSLAAKNSDGEDGKKKKRSLLYRVYRVSTYPVRRVYRLIVPKKTSATTEGDSKALVQDEEDQEESIEEDLDEIKSAIDDTVSAISENIASALKPEEHPPSKDEVQKKPASRPLSIPLPSWPASRSPTAPRGVDLSGEWDLIVTDEFKESYDKYLTLLGQPFFVRSVAMSIVPLTTEVTEQTQNGANLFIRGQNLRGVWERTLVTAQKEEDAKIVTAEGETVACEAWWEGKMHHSWLRGVQKYGGGSFESRRYLDDKGQILVCESAFHPDDETREKAEVTWRFERKKAESESTP